MTVSVNAITRPANATAYTALDVVGGAFQLGGLVNGQEVLITSCDLMIAVAAVPTGMTSFRLHLYNATPPSAIADNAAWDIASGDRDNYIGFVDLGIPVDIGGTLFIDVDQLNRHVRVGNTGLFGYLVTNGGYTPAGNSEVYTVTLRTVPMV